MNNAAIPEQFQTGWLDALDGRMALAKDIRARYRALTDDLGGADALSYAQRSLCERALWLEFYLAEQERDLATGGEFDAGRWTQGCNALLGLFSRLGLKRKARDVPTLREYIAQHTAENATPETGAGT
jgi:hypothetical protein